MNQEKPSSVAGWEEITTQDIEACLWDKDYKKAKQLARLRLERIVGLPKEIDVAIAAQGQEIKKKKWEKQKRKLQEEIDELQRIIDFDFEAD